MCSLIHTRSLVALTLSVAAARSCSALPALQPRDPASVMRQQEENERERRNAILIVHAVCGFLAFQIFAPLAVVVASVGRSWGDVWFKLHYRVQLFVGFTVGLGASAATYDDDGNPMDKHKILGFVLLGVLGLQILTGAWAHIAQKIKRENARPDQVVENKRRAANWMHIAVGIAILSLGGLQVTWGIAEWRRIVGQFPAWISVLHWILAGIPVFIVTPFVLVRGALRMRRGQTFAQAFFDRTPTTVPYAPPRKLFLGSSSYRTVGQDDEKDFDERRGLVDSQRNEFEWVGPTTREEYEKSLRSRDSLKTTTSAAQTFTSDGCLFDAVSEGHPAPSISTTNDEPMDTSLSQSFPTVAVSSSIYPPSRSPSNGGTPFIEREIPTSSISPLSLPTLTPPPPPPPGVSPRLAFMPFAGSAAINHRASSTIADSQSTTRSLTLPSIKSSRVDDHERSVVIVPTPSPPTITASPRPDSRSTSAAAMCDGDGDDEERSTIRDEARVARHASMSGEIVDSAPVLTAPPLGAMLEGEEESDGDGVDGSEVGRDDESTRLMDELERELSISSSSGFRNRRIPGDNFGQGDADETKETDLSRTKSGEWFGRGTKGGDREEQE
ncbi:hypothetical protein JCM3766R1_006527 [Sporobolomyces carnicolor]